MDKKTGEKSKTRPRFIKQDQIAIVRFQSEDVICMETFKDHQQLGRFTLRDEGKPNLMYFVVQGMLGHLFLEYINITIFSFLFRENDCYRQGSEISR